jgi:hypothetical protein
MKKIFYAFSVLGLAIALSGCATSFAPPAPPQGPDSGDDVELGPDSGEEVELGPDSGDEVDSNQEATSPDSGDEEAVEPEPSSPDSGDEIDTSEDDEADDEGDQSTGPDSGDEIDTSDPDKEVAKEDIEEELEAGNGSCDMINDSSVCVTYAGSYWNEMNMKLQCGEAGTFSKKACPSDSLGGCKMGSGTSAENIVWHYGRGGAPLSGEELAYTKKACSAIAGSAWIGY